MSQAERNFDMHESRVSQATALPGPLKAEKRLSTMMIDASNYSLAYDHGLCEALSQQGCGVTLVRSEYLYGGAGGEGSVEEPFAVWKAFYPLVHAYAKTHSRGRMWKIAKAGEHTLSMRRVAAEVERTRPSIVHFQWLPLPFLDLMFLSRLRRIAPLVLTLHNTSVFHGETAYRLLGFGLQAAFKRFDAVVVHTEYSRRKAIEQKWIGDDRLHVIPHGVLTHCRQLEGERPSVPQSPDADSVVLFFGNLKQYKGVDVLIRAFAQLTTGAGKKAKLHIAGNPSMDVKPLRELARELGVDRRIKWDLRFISDNDISSLFASASVVVLPYREIDQSGVLLTAIALEKPVVATRVGGVLETIQDGVHGFVVPPGEPQPMARAIEQIVNDADLRGAMGAAMRNLRKGLAWDRIAQKTIALYRTLSGSRE